MRIYKIRKAENYFEAIDVEIGKTSYEDVYLDKLLLAAIQDGDILIIDENIREQMLGKTK